MTLGTGLEAQGDLAALMSAAEDRQVALNTSGHIEADPSFQLTVSADPSEGVNFVGGSNYSDDVPLDHSMSGLAGMLGAGTESSDEARASLCSNLGAVSGLQGIFDLIEQSDRYLLQTAGRPWPSTRQGSAITRGYLAPTDYAKRSSIASGWNAAAQPGSSPGVLSTTPGYRDINVGPGSYAEAMEYAPSPLAEQAGSLMGFADMAMRNASPGMQKILAASRQPGTEKAAKVAQELLKQSVKLSEVTGKRAAVMDRAREKYRSLLRQVINLDVETQRIAAQLFDANGEPKDNVSPSQIAAYRRLREKAYALGREAIRYQKTNVVATTLTKNGYAQAQLLQNMAMTLLTGAPKATAAMAVQFEELGKESAAARAMREAQVTKWKATNIKEKGLAGFESPVRKAVTADYWEAELAGTEAVELAYLHALEGLWSSIKKAGRSVSRTVKTSSKIVSRVAKGNVKGAAKLAQREASKTARSISRAATKAVGKQAARIAAQAAKQAAKYVTPVTKTLRTMSKPVGDFVQASTRIATAPYKAAYDVGRYAVKGDFKKAVRSVSRNVKRTAQAISTAAAASTIGMQCAFEKTPVGKATAQAVGQAVGSFYGGPVGGAVGNEAGRRANQVSRGVCAGMDKIGLTEGKLRPSRIAPAFKQTARQIYKKTLQPKELLKSAVNIGMNYAAGGASGGLDMNAAKQFATQAGNLSTEQVAALAKQEIQKQVSPENLRRMGQKYIEIEAQRAISKNPYLRKISKTMPYANAVLRSTGAFTGQKVDLEKLRSTIRRDATNALQNEAQRRVQRLVRQNVPQAATAMRAAQFAARVRSMPPAQRRAVLVKQQQILRARAMQEAQRRAAGFI